MSIVRVIGKRVGRLLEHGLIGILALMSLPAEAARVQGQALMITSFTATPSSTTSLPATVVFSWTFSNPTGAVLTCTLVPNPYDSDSKIVKKPCSPVGTASYTYTQAGTYTPTLIVSDGKSEEVMKNTTVEVGAEFTLTLVPANVTLRAGQSAKVRVVVHQANLDEPVHLSLRGAGSGLSGSFDPVDVEDDSSVLTLSADAETTTGTYLLDVDGTSSKSGVSLLHSAALSVAIVTAPKMLDLLATPNPVTLGEATTFHWNFAVVSGVDYACFVDPRDGSARVELPDCYDAGDGYSYIYTTVGMYSALFTLEDRTHGLSTTGSIDVTVQAKTGDGSGDNQLPSMSGLSVEPAGGGTLSGGQLGTIFRWTASDPDGDVLSCTVDPGDKSVPKENLPCSQPYGYTYTSAGNFTATVTARDPGGKAVMTLLSVEVKAEAASNQSPVVDVFVATPSSGGVLVDGTLAVTFTWTASDMNGDALTCAIDPGDGTGAQMLEGVDCTQGSFVYHYTRFQTEEMGGDYAGEWQYDVAPALIVYDGVGGSATALTYVSYTAPAVAPHVIGTDPVDGATNLPVDMTLYMAFNDEMDPISVEGSFSLKAGDGTEVLGTISWLSVGEMLFTPSAPLAENNSYTLSLAQTATSMSGLELESAVSAVFTTVSDPKPVETMPWYGKTYVGTENILYIAFNQTMDPGSVEAGFNLTDAGGTVVPGSFEWNDEGTVVYFTPLQALAFDAAYTLSVSSGMSAETGRALQAFTLPFTTATREVDSVEVSEAAELVGEKIVELGGVDTQEELQALADYILTLDAFGDVMLASDTLCLQATYKSGVGYSYCEQPAPSSEPAAKATALVTPSTEVTRAPIGGGSLEAFPVGEVNAVAASSNYNTVISSSYDFPDKRLVYLMEAYLGWDNTSTSVLSTLATWFTDAGYEVRIQSPTLENLRAIRSLFPDSIGGLYYSGHGDSAEYFSEFGEGVISPFFHLQTDSPVSPTWDAETNNEVKNGSLGVGGIEIWSGSKLVGVKPYFNMSGFGIAGYFNHRFSEDSFVYLDSCHGIKGCDYFRRWSGSKLKWPTCLGFTDETKGDTETTAFSFFSGMLGVPYENPAVSSEHYATAWRPFWVHAVLQDKMYGAADVSKNGNGAVLAESTGKSLGMLLPNLGAQGFNYHKGIDQPELKLLLRGDFGIESWDNLHASLNGEGLFLLTEFDNSLACANNYVPAPYTTMADLVHDQMPSYLLPNLICMDYVVTDLPPATGACGMVQVEVDGLKSNVVPLTCWNGTAEYEADIVNVYFKPESGDDMAAGELTQFIECNVQLIGDVHGEKKSPWNNDEMPTGAGSYTIPNNTACSYVFSGKVTILNETDPGSCEPSELDPGDSCSIVTEERTYTLNETGTLPVGGNSDTRSYPEDYPYVNFSTALDWDVMADTSLLPATFVWKFYDLEPTETFPLLLDESHTIHLETKVTTTRYYKDFDGVLEEENPPPDIKEPEDKPVGFYFDTVFVSSLPTSAFSDAGIAQIDILHEREGVKYRVRVSPLSATNAPTAQTPR